MTIQKALQEIIENGTQKIINFKVNNDKVMKSWPKEAPTLLKAIQARGYDVKIMVDQAKESENFEILQPGIKKIRP